MGSRTWAKIYCDKWLTGTLRDESPEFRGIWVDLLTLAGSGRYGDVGEIKFSDRIGYTDQQLSTLIGLSESDWLTHKEKFIITT